MPTLSIAVGTCRLQWKQGYWVGNAGLSAREGEMVDSARAAHRLHIEALFNSLQPSQQRFPAPKHDGHHGDVHVIDQVRSQELADSRRAPADADVQTAGSLSRCSQDLGGTRVDEVERRTAVELE